MAKLSLIREKRRDNGKKESDHDIDNDQTGVKSTLTPSENPCYQVKPLNNTDTDVCNTNSHDTQAKASKSSRDENDNIVDINKNKDQPNSQPPKEKQDKPMSHSLTQCRIQHTEASHVTNLEKSYNANTLTLTFQDITQLQSSFVEALSRVTNSQTDFIKKAESSFSNAITEAISPIVTAVSGLQKQINTFQNQSKEATKERNLENEEKNHYENHIKELQREIIQLQQDKRKAISESLQWEGECEVLKSKLEVQKKHVKIV